MKNLKKAEKTDKAVRKDPELRWLREHNGLCVGMLAFVLPLFIMLVCYNASGIRPFGKYAFDYMDTFYQYIPFITAFRRALRSGDGLFFTWDEPLGVMGILSGKSAQFSRGFSAGEISERIYRL